MDDIEQIFSPGTDSAALPGSQVEQAKLINIQMDDPCVVRLADEAKSYVVEACTKLGWVLLLNSSTTAVEKRYDVVQFVIEKALAQSTDKGKRIAQLARVFEAEKALNTPTFVKEMYTRYVRIDFVVHLLPSHIFTVALRHDQLEST